MTLNQLEYVINVAETGSINKTASQLFISQSALSTSIKNLEQELGQNIFIRTNKGVEPTAFGKAFISYITPIEHQIAMLDNFLFQRGRNIYQTLSVAHSGYIFMYSLLEEIRARHSKERIHFVLHENSSISIMNEVAQNVVDIGLFNFYDFHMSAHMAQCKAKNLEFQKLLEMDLCVMVGPKNPLYYWEESWVTSDMLLPYPLAMFGYMDVGPFSDIIKRLGLMASPRIHSDSRAALYEAVTFSNAYYLNSDYGRCPCNNMPTQLDYLPRRKLLLRDCPIKSILGWISRSGETLSPLQEELITLLHQFIVPKE